MRNEVCVENLRSDSSWFFLLRRELELERKRLRSFTMYNVNLPFNIFSTRRSEAPMLPVDGDIPGLAIGDRVRLRTISLSNLVEVESTITKVARASGKMKLYLAHRAIPQKQRAFNFHVTFHRSEQKYIRMAEALEIMNSNEHIQGRLLFGTSLRLTGNPRETTRIQLPVSR